MVLLSHLQEAEKLKTKLKSSEESILWGEIIKQY